MTSPSPWQVQASFSDTDGRVRPTLVLTRFICVALAGWTLLLIAGAITAQLRVGLIDSLNDPAAHVDLESVQASDRLTLVIRS
jgi:hypothetical protein